MPPTPAAAHLARRQERHPLSGPDRARQLYRVLAPHLPDGLRSLVDADVVVIGSIGTTVPSIETLPVDPDGYSIEITTGLMAFVYAVSRALAAGTNISGASGGEHPASLELTGVAPRISRVFRAWTRYHQWPWKYLPFWRPRLDKFDYRISTSAHTLAEDLAIRAEAFMLAHELAHVMIGRNLAPADARDEETRADDIGFRLFLPTERSRTGVAGAVCAVRILSGLQRAGFRFSDEYPPPERRLDALFEVLRTLVPCDRHVDELSTIAIAHASFMDDADRLLFGARVVPPRGERQTRVTLIAILEALVTGDITREQGVEDFAMTARSAEASIRAAVFDALIRYYLLEALTLDSYLPRDIALQMGGTLLEMVNQLPADIGSELQAALDRVPRESPR